MVELISYSFSERHSGAGIEGLNLSNFDQPMSPATIIQDIRYELLIINQIIIIIISRFFYFFAARFKFHKK